MNWCHLPVVGGIYDQHPQLLTEWLYIWKVKSEMEKDKQAKAERDAAIKSRRAKS